MRGDAPARSLSKLTSATAASRSALVRGLNRATLEPQGNNSPRRGETAVASTIRRVAIASSHGRGIDAKEGHPRRLTRRSLLRADVRSDAMSPELHAMTDIDR